MNLRFIDWLIVAALLVGIGAVAFLTRRFTRSVSDFLAGNRCAGRYLLTLSEGASGMGMVGILGAFEQYYRAGFAANWWGVMMLMPVALVVALAGWVIYRYRETRAMTMAQFFEMRYSRRFRVFSGIVGWLAGVLNYGVFPGIVARFLIYFCGLPVSFTVGGFHIPMMAPVMIFMLGITLVLVLSGGMVTVMITNFVQAQFINVAFLVIAFVLLAKFQWPVIVSTIETAPPGHSLVNPFDQSGIGDFNIWFFLILVFKAFYNRLGWQGTQGFNCAAKSPHEARMAGILAEWRNGVSLLLFMFIPICAYVLLHNPRYAADAASIQNTLAGIQETQIRTQMTVPMALLHMLPTGVVGLLCAALIAGTIGNDTTYLHAWGSIFIQDVILPFRKTHLSPEGHLRLLRFSIFGVAAFSFVFSLWFPLRDYILMYFLVTGAIYLGGSGAVIIGGLYWKRGTTAGAWCALITGAVIALTGGVLRSVWPSIPSLAAISPEFPLNGAWMTLGASLTSIVVYVGVSLLTCKQDFNMEELLHRGAYAIAGEHQEQEIAAPSRWKWLGINHEFTRGDRFIYFAKILWTFFWFTIFAVGTAMALTVGVPLHLWVSWWHISILLGIVVGVVAVVWFVCGGLLDLAALLKILGAPQRDVSDDGMVEKPIADASPLAESPAGQHAR